jgi:hypothetical protein
MQLCEDVKCPTAVKELEIDNYLQLIDRINGKWKLVKEIRLNDTIDHSCENIIYHFNSDQTLTVYVDETKTEEYE